MDNWISVKEGLPEGKMSTVLAFNADDLGYKHHIFIINYYEQTGWESRIDYTVTHWMPLPSPPKQ